MLHIALKTAQEGQNRLAVTYIFDLLANLAYQREEYTKAENLFKEVLQRMLAGNYNGFDMLVMSSDEWLRVANCCATKGSNEENLHNNLFHFFHELIKFCVEHVLRLGLFVHYYLIKVKAWNKINFDKCRRMYE